MELVVQKFGGTSVGNIERIRNVAGRVIQTRRQNKDVVVVVSAMAGETDRLIKLAHSMTPSPNRRELDQLVSTGEQVTIALLTMAIQSMGENARSFLASQVRIRTDSSFSQARILSIDAGEVKQTIQQGLIAVIAGFQGIDEFGNVTTLGRGGSDTTAVAVAAALGADVCEIYTDVDGVYTADPNICPTAQKLDRISYEEMLELASLGAKVLHIRSVAFAMKYSVPVHVRSSFNQSNGTWVINEERSMEKLLVTAVTSSTSDTKISVLGIPDSPGIAYELFAPIANANINVDMIIQNTSTEGYADISFTVPDGDFETSLNLVNSVAERIGCVGVEHDRNIAKVSIIGVGMKNHSGVAAKMFEILRDHKINIQAVSTSEIKISVIVERNLAREAVRALHDGFGLDTSKIDLALKED